jgi:glyoxylase-like metal-dependent hydrolase (beta-lactamase superfamily II)
VLQLNYPFERLPVAGEALEIAPGVRWVRMPLPYALDHVNLWLVEDDPSGPSEERAETGWALFDTGLFLDEVKTAWETLLSQYRLTRQFVTHCHPDHLGLAAWLEARSGARLWITQGEFSMGHLLRAGIDGYGYENVLAFFALHGLDEARLSTFRQRGNAFLRGVPQMPQSFFRIFDDEIIQIGGTSWQVRVGHGHSPEHAAFYCAERGVLISGDMVLPRITTNVHVSSATPESDALGHYLASIERFRSLPADTLVLPSHGKPFRGLHARLDQLHQHHEARCAALLAACRKAPQSATELLPALFERDISDPHQLQFAMGEAIAHLNYLEHRQQICRHDDGGVVRFALSH